MAWVKPKIRRTIAAVWRKVPFETEHERKNESAHRRRRRRRDEPDEITNKIVHSRLTSRRHLHAVYQSKQRFFNMPDGLGIGDEEDAGDGERSGDGGLEVN